MKSITIDELADIFKEGLSEELHFSGDVTAHSGKGTDTIFFRYRGNVSLSPGSNGQYILSTDTGAELVFTPRGEMVAKGRTYDHDCGGIKSYEPFIQIPLDLTPEAGLNIGNPRNLKY